MDFPAATEALVEAFVAGWTGTAAGTIDLENEIFSPPSDGSAWVRLSVIETPSPRGQRTLGPAGARKFDRTGIVFVQVFSPAEGVLGTGGAKAALTLAELARRFFEAKTISGVKFHAATVRRAKLDAKSAGRWWTVTTECPFYFQETQ